MKTLWDLVRSFIQPEPAAPAPARRSTRSQPPLTPPAFNVLPSLPLPSAEPKVSVHATKRRTKPAVDDAGMQDRYDTMVRVMLDRYGVRVRKWRSSMSGVAWELLYRDGRRVKLIESPKPKGPMSAAVFLHEIGHHAIGLGVYKPRCLEEYHAWAFSLGMMAELNLNVTDSVRRRMHRSLQYAVGKARRRGLRDLPPELEPYLRPFVPTKPVRQNRPVTTRVKNAKPAAEKGLRS